MRVFNRLCSIFNPHGVRGIATLLIISAIACTDSKTGSQNDYVYQPYGGALGSGGSINTSGTGGAQNPTNINVFDSGGASIQTRGDGGTTPANTLDTGLVTRFDSAVGDGSASGVDTGVVARTDGAILDSSPGPADVIQVDTGIAITDTGIGTTDSGNAPYSPCPTNGDPCKILPLGDSITYGLGGSGGFGSSGGGYRVELFKNALADNKNITFVGSVMSGPTEVDGVPFPRNNEGYSGWVINQIANIVPSPALDGQPHIILLMIGTNDIAWAGTRNAPEQLAALIDEIIAANADTFLVVAQITPLGRSNTGVEAYNAAMPAIVDERAAQGAHIMLVDMYTGFSTTNLADGVHPDAVGYKFMADVWYAAIKDMLH